MSITIRINESLYRDAKKIASQELRSTSKQIEFWALIGKYAICYPQTSINEIKLRVIEHLTKQEIEND